MAGSTTQSTGNTIHNHAEMKKENKQMCLRIDAAMIVGVGRTVSASKENISQRDQSDSKELTKRTNTTY
jgi:hypothetical protein